jgi:GNAT superfamily N-acetyltransferase
MNIRSRWKNWRTSVRRRVRARLRPSAQDNRRLLAERGEKLDNFRIREAVAADAAALGALHAQTWAETYRVGIGRAGAKEKIVEEGKWRARQWEDLFDKRIKGKGGMSGGGMQSAGDDWFCLVVENGEGRMVGFAKGQRYAHEDLPEYNGELNKIYVLREYQGLGLGRQLICRMAAKFLEMDVPNMLLFGIAENPSCGFHEAMGGRRIYNWKGEFHGGYGWRDLRVLVKYCEAVD